MNKCSLCNKKISSDNASFGLNCLKKVCSSVGIEDIKNLKGEKLLNKEIQKICKKQGLNNEISKLLTDRYLTLQLLNEVKLEEYDKYRKSVKEDLDTINKITTPKELKSFKKITLSQANEVNKKYKKYKSIFKKIEDGEYDAIQIIPFSAVNFAFNMYYIKKPYMKDLNQKLQYIILKVVVFIAKQNELVFTAKCLDHALQKKPKDMIVTDDKIINKIKKSSKFVSKINEILKKHKNQKSFSIKKGEEYLIFENGDLAYSIHKADIMMKGKKINKKWNLDITITDTYDFTEFKKLQEYIGKDIFISIAGAALNNVGILATSSKVVHPYEITIKFNMTV